MSAGVTPARRSGRGRVNRSSRPAVRGRDLRRLFDEHREIVGRSRICLELDQTGEQQVALLETRRAPRPRRPRRGREAGAGLELDQDRCDDQELVASADRMAGASAMWATNASTRSEHGTSQTSILWSEDSWSSTSKGPRRQAWRRAPATLLKASGSPCARLRMAPEQDRRCRLRGDWPTGHPVARWRPVPGRHEPGFCRECSRAETSTWATISEPCATGWPTSTTTRPFTASSTSTP